MDKFQKEQTIQNFSSLSLIYYIHTSIYQSRAKSSYNKKRKREREI